MSERQPFQGKTRDAFAWAIASRKHGYILPFTVSCFRSTAIALFNSQGSPRYEECRRRGEWIARRLFTEARP